MRMRCRVFTAFLNFPLVCEQGSNTSASAAPPPSQVQLHLQGDPENQKELVQPKVFRKAPFLMSVFLWTPSCTESEKKQPKVFSILIRHNTVLLYRRRIAKITTNCLQAYVQLTACRRSVTKKTSPKENSKAIFHGNRPWGREQAGDEVYINHYNMYIEET